MTETLWELAVASLGFVGGHIVLSSTPLRAVIAGRVGEKAFQGLYSLFMLLLLWWMISAYGTAPFLALWIVPSVIRYAAAAIIAIAFVFAVCGVTSPNPASIVGGPAEARAPKGIINVTRHPLMWGIGLWALAHVVVNGEAASLIFFGSLAVLAFAGMGFIDAKKRQAWGADWETFAARTSVLPFAAIATGRTSVNVREIGVVKIVAALVLFAVFLFAHVDVFGVSAFPF